MTNVLGYIASKYGIDVNGKPPHFIKQNRRDLARLFYELRYTIGVEVGVEQGKYSAFLLEMNPDLFLYSVDAWTAYSGYRDHVSQAKMDRFYQETINRLAPYGPRSEIVKSFSVPAAMQFKAAGVQLDFVYIDGNHEFKAVTDDIYHWSPLVKKGGIVAGHDFKRSKGNYICHVKDVVQAWRYSHHGNDPWFVFNGEGAPSWFWVKS